MATGNAGVVAVFGDAARGTVPPRPAAFPKRRLWRIFEGTFEDFTQRRAGC